MKLTILMVLLLGATSTNAQSSDKIIIDTTALLSQANTMANAFITGDYQSFAKFTYPAVVEMSGGQQAMIAMLEKSVQKMKDDGFSFQSFTVGNVTKIVIAGKELHALLPQQIKMKAPGGTLVTNSYLLAVSANRGKSWSFVDAGNLTEEKINIVFPNFNYNLKIPPKQQPVFNKD